VLRGRGCRARRHDGRARRSEGLSALGHHRVRELREAQQEGAARARPRSSNAASKSRSATVCTTWTFSRSNVAAACACVLSDTALGLPGLTRTPITPEAGNKLCSNCNCFATNVLARKLTPVTLPP